MLRVPTTASDADDAAVKNGWLTTGTDHGPWTVNSIGRITRRHVDWY